MGSELTQQPNMLRTLRWEPIDFINSISSRSWSLASLSVESENKKVGITIVLEIQCAQAPQMVNYITDQLQLILECKFDD